MVFSCFQGYADREERSDVRVSGRSCVWATPKPSKTGIPHLLFVGLNGSGKSIAIQTLVHGPPAPPGSGKHKQAHPLPPAPTLTGQCSYVPSSGNLIPSPFIAVEAPGTAAQREGWGDAMGRCDGVVVVVDTSDSPRIPVLRDCVWRLLPRMIKKGAPCIVLANPGSGVMPAMGSDMEVGKDLHCSQESSRALSAGDLQQQHQANMDDIIAELDLPTLFAPLTAPWAVRAGEVWDWNAVADASGWLLSQVARMHAVPLSTSSAPRASQPHPRVMAACAAVNTDFAAQFAATRALQQQQQALAGPRRGRWR